MHDKVNDLQELMRLLRDKTNGCAWCREQTFASIVPYTIEEAYEVADAIVQNDMVLLKEELADLLLQIGFYTEIAREQGLFDFQEVEQACIDKQLRRNPDLFSGQNPSADQAYATWQAQKAKEQGSRSSVLEGVSPSLPAVQQAIKLQERAAQVGFEWPSAEPILDKIDEELDELIEAMEQGDMAQIEDELGDLLFVSINLIRKLKLNPEVVLRKSNEKFTRRFKLMEDMARKNQQDLVGLALESLETLWGQAKRQLAE